ncbi:MICOS complex subunit Mic10 [Colletes latitarsis]|uniref:MICOS complex subunit Mic10 n=1 Tax=Colletes latitarsis TaxID=2605962 RepID=UPI0040361500
MAGATWAEDEIGRKWDRCFTDALFKFGGGVFLGGVFSLFFFKRRKWPILSGAGFGLGMAYSNCQEDLNSSIRSRQKPKDCSKVVPKDEAKKSV